MKKTIYFSIANFLFLFCSLSESQAQNVGINGSGATAHASALLDLDDVAGGNNKGLLIPRIPLTAINAAAPVTSPATSLLVYNTATASTGTNAVSPGYYYWDGAKWVRFAYNASGSFGDAWTTLGNAGTVDGTNFIGTTDNVPFNIRVNNQKAGRIDNSLQNTAFGYQALNSNTTGSLNVAVGSNALYSNIVGSQVTAIGNEALYNNTANNNTSIGSCSMRANTTGANNTAVGLSALRANTTGSFNNAFGQNALSSNTTGDNNVAMGNGALVQNTSASYNTAIGVQALSQNTAERNTALGFSVISKNTTGTQNVAIGAFASDSNTVGSFNTSLGYLALRSNITGSLNVAIGYRAGDNLTNNDGNSNTYIGAYSDATANSFTNSTAIGYNAKVGASNALILGGTGSNAVNVGIGTTTPTEKLEVQGSVKIVDGTQGLNKVLTSDASGKGSWVDPSLNLFQGSWALGYNSVPISTVNTNPTYTGLSIVLPPGKYLVTAQVGFQALANSPTWRYLGYSTSIIPTTVTNTRFLGGRIGGTQPTYNESFIHYVTWTVDLSSMSGNTTLYFFQSDTVTLTNGLSGCCGDQYSVSALPVK